MRPTSALTSIPLESAGPARRRWPAVALLAATVLAAGCSKPASSPEASAVSAGGPAASPPASKVVALLPDDGAVAGWTRKSVKVYGADNLWEFIDGGAEAYLACGHQEVVTSEYVNPAEPSSVLLDVYRLADPRGAFGIYSQEATAGADFRPIGTEGYAHGTVVNFWSGPYYVKLTTYRESESLTKAMITLAEAVSRKIGPASAPPQELTWFPHDGLVPHSVRYLPVRVLGQPYLSNGFEARYRDGGAEYTLAVVTPRSGEDPKSVFAKYREYATTDRRIREMSGVEDEAFVAQSANGVIVAARRANRFAIAVGPVSAARVMPQLRAVLANSTATGRTQN